jgi:hypothetical protein
MQEWLMKETAIKFRIKNLTLISAKLLHDYKGKVAVVDNNVANAIGNNYLFIILKDELLFTIPSIKP